MSTSMSVEEGGQPAPRRRFFTREPGIGAAAAARQVIDDARTLVSAELALAKAELSAGIQAKGIGVAFLAVAGVAAWLGLQGLLITLGFVLAIWLPGWAAALIVTVLLLLVAGIAALLGRRKLATPVSVDETKRNLAEDVAVARAALRRGGSGDE